MIRSLSASFTVIFPHDQALGYQCAENPHKKIPYIREDPRKHLGERETPQGSLPPNRIDLLVKLHPSGIEHFHSGTGSSHVHHIKWHLASDTFSIGVPSSSYIILGFQFSSIFASWSRISQYCLGPLEKIGGRVLYILLKGERLGLETFLNG
jgi:hypothetical protein